MQSLGRVLASAPSAADDYWYGPRGQASSAGMTVTPDSAMTVSAVYACVTFIAESIASVPLPIYQWVQMQGQRGKHAAPNMPLWDILNYQPNDHQTALEFREMMTAFAMLRPRGIAEILPGPRGPVDQLVPLHPDLVTRETLTDGTIRYRYRDPLRRGQERILTADRVFVVGGRFGRSVLEFARETIGLDLAMQRHQGQLFSRGARPAGALQTTKILDDTQKTNLRAALDEYGISGQYSGRPLLLQDGMTWESIGLSSHDSELAASRQLSIADAARFFRVPLHKIQELHRATNNNIEEQGRDAVEGLIPWAERWEQAIRRDLIVAKSLFFAEHNLDGLQRGNTKDRFDAYAIAIMWGIFNPNEVRALENRNPYVGGETYITPLNEGPVGGSGKPPMSPNGSPNARSVDLDAPISAGVVAQLRLFMRDAAARAVRKEQATLAKLAERTGGSGETWTDGVRTFFGEHAEFVSRVMRLSETDAIAYATGRETRLLAAGPRALDEDEIDRIDALHQISLERSADLNGGAGLPVAAALMSPPAPVVNLTIAEGAFQAHTAGPPDVHVNIEPGPRPDVHVTVEAAQIQVAVPPPDMAPVAAAVADLGSVLTIPRKVSRDAHGRIDGLRGVIDG